MQPDHDVVPAQLSAVIQASFPGWQVVRAWPLSPLAPGRVTGLDIARAGAARRLILRQYGPPDTGWAGTEFGLLRLLHAAGLPVPRPWHASGGSLLIDHIDGDRVTDPPDLTAFTDGLATALAALHEVVMPRAGVAGLPDVLDAWALSSRTSARPDDALSEPVIRAALGRVWPPSASHPPVILHGDYWPGNTLWRDGALTGIIDWEDAMTGDPLADVAVARQELAWFFGPGAMSAFTARYRQLRPIVDVTALPAWDLRAALRPAGKLASWGLSASQQASMIAAHRQFVSEALGQLTDPRRRP